MSVRAQKEQEHMQAEEMEQKLSQLLQEKEKEQAMLSQRLTEENREGVHVLFCGAPSTCKRHGIAEPRRVIGRHWRSGKAARAEAAT